jgi:hypothetical protein
LDSREGGSVQSVISENDGWWKLRILDFELNRFETRNSEAETDKWAAGRLFNPKSKIIQGLKSKISTIQEAA